MMWGYGSGMGVWGYTLMTISTVLFWALIIGGVIALVRYFARADRSTGDTRTAPEQVLAERFAAGEIDEQEYQQRLDVLRGQRRELPKP
jgi:putative membrane protein